MSERDGENPLSHLKALEPLPLSDSAEAERRQRVVGRIDALRAQLGHPELGRSDVRQGQLEPKPAPAVRRFAFVRKLDVRLRYTLAAIVPLALALVFFLDRPTPESQVFVHAGELTLHTPEGTKHLGRDAHWSADNEVVLSTDATNATIVLPDRTALQFAPQTRVHLQSRSGPPAQDMASNTTGTTSKETLRLERGAVTLSGDTSNERSLSVTTTHTLVQVRAATFALTVEQTPAGDRTRVVVRQGDVSVWAAGREYRLKAGQEWVSPDGRSPDVATPSNAGPGPEPTSTSAAPSDVSVTQSAAPRSSTEPKTKGSDLALQNQLFESAQAARRAGQTELALQRFATLIRAYPASEQAHNARVEEFRLLRSLGRKTQASRSARAYLRAHPRGFAAEEARRWLATEQ